MTDWHIFGGYVEVVLKAAPGAGIVSSFVLQSDTLDEIDWEMIGSDVAQVQSNYFGKGNTTTYDRGQYHPVPPPQQTFIKYAVNWTMDSTVFLLNDQPVRTLNFADAVGGANYPQTPMNIRLGNWIAGQEGNSPGTIEWAGGIADLAQAPFDMYVQSVRVINYSPAASYKYSDQSGSWQSIQSLQDPPQKGTVGVGSSAPGSSPAPAPEGAAPVPETPAPGAPAEGDSGNDGMAPGYGSHPSPGSDGGYGGAPAPGVSSTITVAPGGYGGGGYGSTPTQAANSSAVVVSGGTTYTISAGAAVPSGGYGGNPYGNGTNPFPQGGGYGGSNGTAPTVTIETDTAPAPATTLQTAGSSQQSFGLGPSSPAAQSSGPAQVTSNPAPRLQVDRVAGGLLALALGYAVV